MSFSSVIFVCPVGFNSMRTKNFQMFKLDLEKAEEADQNCQHPLDHRKNNRIPEELEFCFIDYTKAFDYVDHNKQWKFLQQMGITDYLTCLLKNLYAGQEATVRIGHGTKSGKHDSKLGKEYIKAVYCHPAYLTYMKSTSCEMPGWMKHKLESRLPGEISITSDMQMTPPL